jgi:hypothetical protein
MARKRKPEQPATKTDNTASTATIEPPTETPFDVQPAETHPVDPPPVEQSPTFVERFAVKSNRPLAADPFLIALDNEAGVRLFENRQARVMAIKFEEKPGQLVIDRVKEQGYRWSPQDRVWTRPIRSDSALSTRIDAERLYQEVRDMIRQDKDINGGRDTPF